MPTPQKVPSSGQQPASKVSQLFVEKYDLLLQWAVRLTRGDREQAEDLLHEAFVQFTLRQLDFVDVEDIEAYLYTILKHFHLSSLRRARRDPLSQLSLVEFDSVDLALRSSFDFDQVQVQNDLRRVCAFLCWRKGSAKSASYLILRFFHGYYPEEVRRIALTSRDVVDHGIRLAAGEAKAFLADPGRLRFMPGRPKRNREDESQPEAPGSLPAIIPVLFAVPAAEFLHVLNETIITSRTDACLPREELLAHYEQFSAVQGAAGANTVASVDRALLAHLVSCPPCLDAVNHYLRMPPLSDRFPGERLGNSRRTPGKGGSAVRRAPKGTGSEMRNEQTFHEMQLARESILRVAQARLRECFEHQPRKLFVAVNGETIATQDIASDRNKQSVRLHHRKTVDFVEVFSEQGIRLAFISVIAMPPEGPDSLSQQVSLSAGRSLDVVLEFTASGPMLEVAYCDPLQAHSIEVLDAEMDESLRLIAPLSDSSEIPPLQADQRKPFLIQFRDHWNAFVDRSRPLVISMAITMVFAVVATVYFVQARYKMHVARTLLAEAAQQESNQAAKGRLVHRVFAFTVTSTDDEHPIENGTVDLWKSADQHRVAMRLSARDGKLLAGIWQAADGSYSIYRDHRLTGGAVAPENLRGTVAPADSEDLWMNEPSATRFEALAANKGELTEQESGNEAVVDYRSESRSVDEGRPHLVRATLILRHDRHVAGQVFWIESDGEVRRYSYREVSYEERDIAPPGADVFSPDPGLAGRVSFGRRMPSLKDNSDFLAHLNLEAFALLSTVNADSGEQISIRRTPSQHLAISGVLASDERLAQVKAALSPLMTNPLVDITLWSAQHPDSIPASTRRKGAQTVLTAQSVEINAQTIPAQERLKAYFSRRGHSGKDLDQQIETFSQDTLGHSSRALQQAWTLHTLASSFSTRDWQHMSADDRKQWIAMYLRHSTALSTESQAIRQSLDVLRMNVAGDSPEAAQTIPAIATAPPPVQISLYALSDQLLEQSSIADRLLRSALTASTGPTPDLDALCGQLHASLSNTDRAIREIEHRAQDLETSQATHSERARNK